MLHFSVRQGFTKLQLESAFQGIRGIVGLTLLLNYGIYLPHHPVTNENKPGKVRRVSNASSVFLGQSLNSNFVTGPDLLINLTGIILRFRENIVIAQLTLINTSCQKKILKEILKNMDDLYISASKPDEAYLIKSDIQSGTETFI